MNDGGIACDAKYLPAKTFACDMVHFGKALAWPRVCLHACMLGFKTPYGNDMVHVRCAVPPDMSELINNTLVCADERACATGRLVISSKWILDEFDQENLLLEERANNTPLQESSSEADADLINKSNGNSNSNSNNNDDSNSNGNSNGNSNSNSNNNDDNNNTNNNINNNIKSMVALSTATSELGRLRFLAD